MIIRPHIKMLTGDYQCYAYISSDRGADPSCILCKVLFPSQSAPPEDLVHLLTSCRATADTRNSYLPDLLNCIATYFPSNKLLDQYTLDPDTMTQFLLDCSSLNLPADIRIPHNHPSFFPVTRQCSVMINGIHKDRCRQLAQSTWTVPKTVLVKIFSVLILCKVSCVIISLVDCNTKWE